MYFVVDCQNAVKTDILIILIASATLSEYDFQDSFLHLSFLLFRHGILIKSYDNNPTAERTLVTQLLMATLKNSAVFNLGWYREYDGAGMGECSINNILQVK